MLNISPTQNTHGPSYSSPEVATVPPDTSARISFSLLNFLTFSTYSTYSPNLSRNVSSDAFDVVPTLVNSTYTIEPIMEKNRELNETMASETQFTEISDVLHRWPTTSQSEALSSLFLLISHSKDSKIPETWLEGTSGNTSLEIDETKTVQRFDVTGANAKLGIETATTSPSRQIIHGMDSSSEYGQLNIVSDNVTIAVTKPIVESSKSMAELENVTLTPNRDLFTLVNESSTSSYDEIIYPSQTVLEIHTSPPDLMFTEDVTAPSGTNPITEDEVLTKNVATTNKSAHYRMKLSGISPDNPGGFSSNMNDRMNNSSQLTNSEISSSSQHLNNPTGSSDTEFHKTMNTTPNRTTLVNIANNYIDINVTDLNVTESDITEVTNVLNATVLSNVSETTKEVTTTVENRPPTTGRKPSCILIWASNQKPTDNTNPIIKNIIPEKGSGINNNKPILYVGVLSSQQMS